MTKERFLQIRNIIGRSMNIEEVLNAAIELLETVDEAISLRPPFDGSYISGRTREQKEYALAISDVRACFGLEGI